MASLCILTEAGPNIGLGHFSRCCAIACAARQSGAEVVVVVNTTEPRQLPNAPYVIVDDWLADTQVALTHSAQCDVLLVDSYLADKEVYRELNDVSERLAVLDDFNRIEYPAHLIINPNGYAHKLNYSNQDARVAGGWDYLLLRPSFTQNDRSFEIRREVQNILITVGGSDYRGLIPAILGPIEDLGYSIHVAAGTQEHADKLKETAESCTEVYAAIDAEEMLLLMTEADIVISAAGQTLHELAYLGIPTIAVCIDDDQTLNISDYCEQGFIQEPLDWDTPDLITRVLEALTNMADYNLRREASRIGGDLIDGRGAERSSRLLLDI